MYTGLEVDALNAMATAIIGLTVAVMGLAVDAICGAQIVDVNESVCSQSGASKEQTTFGISLTNHTLLADRDHLKN